MIRFIGWKFSKGAFVPDGKSEEVSFDKIHLHMYTDADPSFNGMCTSVIKIPRDQAGKLLGVQQSDKEITDYLNSMLGFDFVPTYVPINGRTVLTKIDFAEPE